MRPTIWKKYESDGNDGFPKGLTVDVCDTLGEIVEYDKKYSEFYFIPKEDAPITVIGDSGNKLNPPSDIKRTCKWVEERIYKDCKKQDWIPVDIFRILAWKTGKINHPESMKTEPNIIYNANWIEGKEDDKFVSLQIPYQKNVVEWVELEPIVHSLLDIRKEYCSSKDSQSAWNSILSLANDDKNKNAMRGIGTVYLITLLHFITDGEVPIYDRFAMASLAIWKLKNDQKELCITDKSVIRGCKLPSKDTKAAIKILESGIYSDYIHLLNEFCKVNYGNENEWKTNRDVDRGLWVFGHYFEVDE